MDPYALQDANQALSGIMGVMNTMKSHKQQAAEAQQRKQLNELLIKQAQAKAYGGMMKNAGSETATKTMEMFNLLDGTPTQGLVPEGAPDSAMGAALQNRQLYKGSK